MTHGRIDLKIVADRLTIVSFCVTAMRRLPSSRLDEFEADWRNAAAADSLLRRAIEALFDTARHVLAKAFGLGPLEYREVARLAAEKGLVAKPALQARLREIAGFRNRLTHFYDEVTSEEIFAVMRDELGDLEALAEQLRIAATRLSQA
jgi:uncharacterized protein YutE (UPF0331/DUF86 family)